MPHYWGIEAGGSKFVCASGSGPEDAEFAEFPTTTPEETIGHIVDFFRSVESAAAIGIASFGPIDPNPQSPTYGYITSTPKLAWRNFDFAGAVQRALGKPIAFDTDVNAAALGEAHWGAARGVEDFLYLTVGTGIGAAIVINGQLYRGRWGVAGEPGHYRVVPGGRLCGCGNRGCWEQYASGNALVAEAREFAGRSPGGAVRLLQLGGGTPDGITGPAITQAAREGDPAALRCFEIVGSWLGQGLADLAAILDPACFVIGGGVSESGDLLLSPARAAFEASLTGKYYRPFAEIRLAELGENAGLVGAADLARRG